MKHFSSTVEIFDICKYMIHDHMKLQITRIGIKEITSDNLSILWF